MLRSFGNPADFIVHRLVRLEHTTSAFSGKGGRRFAGRWNAQDYDVAYTAASRALAMLELLVQTTANQQTPLRYQCFSVAVPKGLEIAAVRAADLPANWRTSPAPPQLQQIGSDWLEAGNTAVLRVPSAVIPQENNFILNLKHDAFARLQIAPPESLDLDERLLARSR